MNNLTAEEYLRQGDLEGALQMLKEQVRAQPANVQHRIFLFQLLCIQGDWQRALTQLNVAGELDDSTLAMVAMYRQVIACECFREEVFQGNKEPVVFGQPEQWVALLLEALKLTARGEYARSQELRAQAFDAAPATSGTIDAREFAWLADSDSRTGPIIEAMVDGRYLWVPQQRIKAISIDAPEDLRDLVWLPSHFFWSNGGESYGLIPARYPGSYKGDDPLLALSRKTEWQECAADLYLGMGQKIFTTDSADYPLLDVREIVFNSDDESPQEQPGG